MQKEKASCDAAGGRTGISIADFWFACWPLMHAGAGLLLVGIGNSYLLSQYHRGVLFCLSAASWATVFWCIGSVELLYRGWDKAGWYAALLLGWPVMPAFFWFYRLRDGNRNRDEDVSREHGSWRISALRWLIVVSQAGWFVFAFLVGMIFFLTEYTGDPRLSVPSEARATVWIIWAVVSVWVLSQCAAGLIAPGVLAQLYPSEDPLWSRRRLFVLFLPFKGWYCFRNWRRKWAESASGN
ncbi:MAG: hypothetical protein V5A84_03975 [Planctomycetota bacterium]